MNHKMLCQFLVRARATFVSGPSTAELEITPRCLVDFSSLKVTSYAVALSRVPNPHSP